MNESITYKCPECGAAMVFNSDAQQLVCPYCSAAYNVDEYMQRFGGGAQNNVSGEDEQQEAAGYEEQQSRIDYAKQHNMKKYHCTSCGAELVSDEFTSATICGFCGNPTLVCERLNGEFSPSLIIPFKLNKEAATDAFVKWARKGLLTPGDFHSSSTIEKLSGIYVPFWFYDVHADNRMHGTGLRVRREDHANYYYTITDFYDVARDIDADFIRVPADASEKMNDGDMDKLEPFDYSELRKFEMPYLSGYLSERYNYTAEDMRSRVFLRTNRYITDATTETLAGYTSIEGRSDMPSSRVFHEEYALLPVWMLNYHYKDQDYTFLMNGQTGRIVATRPISSLRTVVSFFISFILVLIIVLIGGLIIW